MIGVLMVGSAIGGAIAVDSWRVAMLLVPALGLVLVGYIPRILPIMPRSGEGPVDYRSVAITCNAMLASSRRRKVR